MQVLLLSGNHLLGSLMQESHHLKFPKETMLELVQLEGGEIVLRPVESNDVESSDDAANEPLVSIQFSDKVKELLGEDVHGVGQHMIHSALQILMHQQLASWHAQVVDEEPAHYS